MQTDWTEARKRLERISAPRNAINLPDAMLPDLRAVLARIDALEAEKAWPTSEDEADRLLLRALQARLTYGDGSDPGTPEDVDEAVAYFTAPDKWPVYRRMTVAAAEAFCAAGRQPPSPAGAGSAEESAPYAESWRERARRLMRAKDYAAVLAMLRAPAPAIREDVGGLPDEAVEAAARARYEASRDGYGPSSTSRWATWEEACQIEGWRQRQCDDMRDALAVLALLKTPSPPEPFEGPFPGDDEVGAG